MRLQGSHVRYMIVAGVLAIATVIAGIAPAIVAAAQLSERSIALSSSSKAATNVEYNVSFTATKTAAAVVLDFCSNTPLLGEACTKPAGLVLTGAASAGSTDVVADDVNGDLTIDRAITTGANNFTVTGITNPNTAETMYVRIITFGTAADADGYTSVAPGDQSKIADSGSVAVAITNTVGVSGSVLETLTFCVAKIANDDPIAANCADANTAGNEPVLTLGTEVGAGSGVFALAPGVVSEGVLQTQISTNASGGAVVRLKSDSTGCGGLLRMGADPIAERCIEPAMAQLLNGSAEFFGVKTNAASVSGTFGTVAPTGSYNNTAYRMTYAGDNQSGVTSVLGDPFLSTGGAPVADANMGITFGASATNQTPAGTYSADLRLIATGTF